MSVSSRQSQKTLRRMHDMCDAGLIDEAAAYDAIGVESCYDIAISPHIQTILSGVKNPTLDPVGRQYIPTSKELKTLPDEDDDPIGDNAYSPVNGVVHRYPDRVLLKVTNACAVYCRYCFRREMIGAGAPHLSDDDFMVAIDYIKSTPEIWEVILTGGDPFVLSPRRLQNVIEALNNIDHVKNIRIHSKLPIASPEKIKNTTHSVLKSSSKPVHIVLHVNHPNEISPKVVKACDILRDAGCSLYAQSVLLNKVNDNEDTLETLFKTLISMHVKPYYLHHLDRAKGTSHFRVSLARGMAIMKALQGRVSGTCLPKYMLDIPGGHGKIPVHEGYVTALEHGVYRLEDYQGCHHLYFDQQEGEAL